MTSKIATMTLSERLFEQYCGSIGVPFNRIAESDQRTPDYKIAIDNQTVVVEVKEIKRNKEEKESDRVLAERGFGNVLGGTPGDRVRGKIDRCSKQIKAHTQGALPGLLVLFDRGLAFDHLDPYHIRVAMYGLEQIHMALPPLQSGTKPYVTGLSFGPKRKMSPVEKTAISAIGVLHTPERDRVALSLFHNKFAAVPLDPRMAARLATEQYLLENDAFGRIPNWVSVEL